LTATVSAQLAATAAQLAEAGIEAARLEARLLLAHALGCDQETLLLRRDEPVAAPALAALLARRRAREPLARKLE
jgi:release factor glutamine methyltransferase